METRAKIRHLFNVKKHTISQISRELQLSRNTIKRILKTETIDQQYRRKSQPSPKMVPRMIQEIDPQTTLSNPSTMGLNSAPAPKRTDHKEQLKIWLTEEKPLPKNQRCSSRKFFERLKTNGYTGAYDSVQRFVKQWQFDDGKITDAYVPLFFAPGEAYQFDWSQETVELGGVVHNLQGGPCSSVL